MTNNDCRIQLSRAGSTRPLRTTNVHLTFGDGHQIHVLAHEGQVQVILANAHCSVALDANGPQCQFERAVNLLRLHLGISCLPSESGETPR